MTELRATLEPWWPVALFYLLASLPYWTLQRPRRPTVSQPVETKPL